MVIPERLRGTGERLALASGLSWDQAITAFGIASKAIAAQAASQGNGTLEQCTAHARQRLAFGMEQGSDVLKAWLRRARQAVDGFQSATTCHISFILSPLRSPGLVSLANKYRGLPL